MQEWPPPDYSPIGHLHGASGLPADARRLGLDRNTEEGALIALAGSLNPAKRSHRIVAWVVLVCFAAPVVLSTLHLVF